MRNKEKWIVLVVTVLFVGCVVVLTVGAASSMPPALNFAVSFGVGWVLMGVVQMFMYR